MRAVSGATLILDCAVMSFFIRTQKIRAKTTLAEVESVATGEVLKEALSPRQVQELAMANMDGYLTPIKKDRQELSKRSTTSTQEKRTGYTEIEDHVRGDTVEQGKAKIIFVNKNRQDACVLTRQLEWYRMNRCVVICQCRKGQA